MRLSISLLLVVFGFGLLCVAWSHSGKWDVAEEETIDRTLTLSGQNTRLVVDNENGYVHVNGTTGSQVHLVAHKKIHAETQSDLARANSEVKLEIGEKPGLVSIEYTAPWHCKGNCGGSSFDRRHFEVKYDIDIEVPRQASTAVSTVNGGIHSDAMEGDFDLKGVNGGIRLTHSSGSGTIHTVNGSISIQFARNPVRPCNFNTVNGALDVEFQQGLSADLLFKTVHGGTYSNFDVTPFAVLEARRQNGMFVYHSDSQHRGRVGHGGPQLSFQTVNGSIRLREEKL